MNKCAKHWSLEGNVQIKTAKKMCLDLKKKLLNYYKADRFEKCYCVTVNYRKIIVIVAFFSLKLINS